LEKHKGHKIEIVGEFADGGVRLICKTCGKILMSSKNELSAASLDKDKILTIPAIPVWQKPKHNNIVWHHFGRGN
jgi:hypothetical protein